MNPWNWNWGCPMYVSHHVSFISSCCTSNTCVPPGFPPRPHHPMLMNLSTNNDQHQMPLYDPYMAQTMYGYQAENIYNRYGPPLLIYDETENSPIYKLNCNSAQGPESELSALNTDQEFLYDQFSPAPTGMEKLSDKDMKGVLKIALKTDAEKKYENNFYRDVKDLVKKIEYSIKNGKRPLLNNDEPLLAAFPYMRANSDELDMTPIKDYNYLTQLQYLPHGNAAFQAFDRLYLKIDIPVKPMDSELVKSNNINKRNSFPSYSDKLQQGIQQQRSKSTKSASKNTEYEKNEEDVDSYLLRIINNLLNIRCNTASLRPDIQIALDILYPGYKVKDMLHDASNKCQSRSLYLLNLYNLAENEKFKSYIQKNKIKILYSKLNTTGEGYLNFSTYQEASDAFTKLNRLIIDEKPIKVSYSIQSMCSGIRAQLIQLRLNMMKKKN